VSSSKWKIGALIVGLSAILSRILGLGRDVLLARTAGLGPEADAYNLAFLLPDLLNHFTGAGLLSVTLIPLLSKSLKNNEFDEAVRKINAILLPVFGLSALSCCILFMGMEEILPYFVQKMPSAQVFELAVYYSRIVLFAQLAFLIGGFFNALQYGSYKYWLPAMAPLVYNTSILIGGGIGAQFGKLEGFCWGVLIGAFIGNAGLQIVGAIKMGWRLNWSWDFPLFRKYLWRTLPFILGVSAIFSNEFAYRYFGISTPGDSAALGFALRIGSALSGVLGGALGIAIYPKISEMCSEGKYKEAGELMLGAIERLIWGMLPAAAILSVLAKPLSLGILGGGVFGLEDAERVALPMTLYLIQAIPVTLVLLSSRMWFADGKTWFPSIVSAGCFAISLPFYNILEFMGSMRIPLLGIAVATLQTIVLVWGWKRQKEFIIPLKIVFKFLIPIGISILAIGLNYILLGYVETENQMSSLFVSTIFVGLSYILCLLAMSMISGSPLQGIHSKILSRFSRKKGV
jgi:putative peptidoglycan lipid II flippase